MSCRESSPQLPNPTAEAMICSPESVRLAKLRTLNGSAVTASLTTKRRRLSGRPRAQAKARANVLRANLWSCPTWSPCRMRSWAKPLTRLHFQIKRRTSKTATTIVSEALCWRMAMSSGRPLRALPVNSSDGAKMLY